MTATLTASIPGQEIAAFPLILLERKASSRVFLEQEFLKAGVTLTPEIELSSRQLLVTLAEIGLGVAGVTLEFVHKELESGGIRLLKTDFDIPERSVDMCTLREVHPTAGRPRPLWKWCGEADKGMERFLFIFEMIGTVAFAASGAILGIRKGMDIFGVCILGLTTACGGGMVRDVLLGKYAACRISKSNGLGGGGGDFPDFVPLRCAARTDGEPAAL